MTSKKLKKTFTAAFLSGSILLQNFPALAAASDTTDWLKESPFRQDITTEKSTPTESVPSETETVSPETLSTFQTEAETEAETEIPEESKSSNNTASFLMADNSDTFSQILQEATLTPSYTFDSLNQDFSWKELKTELTRRVNSYSSKWSVYLKALTTGNVISINERAQESASLIKLYVMGAVMQEIQNGNLEMNDENYDQITGQYGRDSVDSNLYSMITVSDNSATNELVRYLNKDHDHKKGMKKVNAFIKAQGFEYTHEYNGLEDTSLWYDADTKNTTSAKDCGRLLERIYRGEFISHLASRQMEELLLNQQVTYKIPSTIPSESRVANKTGETSDCENDAAIVYTPKGDYILCIMSCEVSSKSSAVDSLQEMSSLIYSYFMNRDTSKVSRQVEATAKETD